MAWIKIGALVMAAAIILGAFGAHALKSKLSVDMMEVYKTAVLYHALHALGLLFIGVLSLQSSDTHLLWAGIFLGMGILLFSGSLYVMALTGIKWLGAITPLGGVSFILGWFSLSLMKGG